MRKLKFKDDSAAQDRLARAQGAIDDYSAAHPDELSDKEHEEFRSLLHERADALSEATGMKIHSLFGDD